MKRSDYRRARDRLSREIGMIRKDWGGRLPIGLCYPNSYRIGMCNLGFQALYGLLNARPDVVCERLFAEPPGTLEAVRNRLATSSSRTSRSRSPEG